MKLVTALSTITAAAALSAGSIELSNEYWSVSVDPANGCRASKLILKSSGKDLINTWQSVKRHAGPIQFGGVWGGHMAGSYNDEQGTTPYKVIRSGKDQLVAVWDNPYQGFKGLREERTVALDGSQIRVKIKITNRSKEKRTFFYRMQDFILSRMSDSGLYGVVPGAEPEVFPFYDWTFRERVFMKPEAKGIAVFNTENNSGLLITATGDVNGIFTWFAKSINMSTVEFFMEQAFLEPGGVWETEFTYNSFDKKSIASLPAVWKKRLDRDAIASGNVMPSREIFPLPYHAVCKPDLDPAQLQIVPVSPAAQVIGKAYPVRQRITLESMRLFGTPGERVDFVFALKAGKKKIHSAWKLNPFTAADNSWNLFGKEALNDLKWDLRYLTDGGYFLVHDQKLASRSSELAALGNKLHDPDVWSDLTLAPGAVAWVKLSCMIPENAKAGNYESIVEVAGQKVRIDLKVLPYRLKREDAKGFGSFFRAYISSSNPQRKMSKEEFLASLRFATENWNNSIVIYTPRKDELLWSVEQMYKLGWRNSVICPIYRVLSPAEIKGLEAKYGYKFLTWGVDEPATYKLLNHAVQQLKKIKKGGYQNPTFTPSTFMGALFADICPDYIPIFNTNGMMTILMDRTRRYAKEKRRTFWYSCPLGFLTVNEQLKERLVHGIYLWKMPVEGIFDWGEDVHVTRLDQGGYCGFAGKKFLSTIRRDNNYEGYKDYLYLKQLTDAVKANPDVPAAAEARKFMKELAAHLDDNYYTVVAHVDDVFLDNIREKAAELTVKVLSGK